jgi:hypothetical protein
MFFSEIGVLSYPKNPISDGWKKLYYGAEDFIGFRVPIQDEYLE